MPTLPTTGEILPAPVQTLGPDPEALNQAFESFAQAAGSLEASYGQLQAELAGLRHELEVKNRDLQQSLAANESMRAWLSRTLQGLPCGVLVADSKLQLRLANPEARRLLAIDQKSTLRNFTPVPESLQKLLVDIIFSGPGAERIWPLEGGEGERLIAITCAVLPEPTSERGDFVFILRDVTEQRRMERERESARRLQALGEMTTVLAHEIRNPLASLELFAGLISDATREQLDVSQWCVHLQAGLRALSATVNNVLQFHTQAPPQRVPVNVEKLLDDTLEFLQPLALQRGMAIRLMKPNDNQGGIWIQSDAHRLQQVFFNLAINAFRAMSSGGMLTVRVRRGQLEGSNQGARIDFEDQGSGIAPENFQKIFAAGFTTTPGSPGLGLAVSKRVVEQNGGTLRVKSAPRHGSTFTMAFPS
jgi:signal transduction histidine kinase